MVYIKTKWRKNISKGYAANTMSKVHNLQRAYSVKKIIGRLNVLHLCGVPDDTLYVPCFMKLSFTV